MIGLRGLDAAVTGLGVRLRTRNISPRTPEDERAHERSDGVLPAGGPLHHRLQFLLGVSLTARAESDHVPSPVVGDVAGAWIAAASVSAAGAGAMVGAESRTGGTVADRGHTGIVVMVVAGLVKAGVAGGLWYRYSRKYDGSDGGRRRMLGGGAIVAMPLQCASTYALARATLEVAEHWTTCRGRSSTTPEKGVGWSRTAKGGQDRTG